MGVPFWVGGGGQRLCFFSFCLQVEFSQGVGGRDLVPCLQVEFSQGVGGRDLVPCFQVEFSQGE